MNTTYSPHDLLPIENPFEEEPEDQTYFYENVIKHLIPDIIDMAANGIPINLEKVSELEKVVVNVLKKVHDKLKNNKLMLKFLEETSKDTKKQKIAELDNKKKTIEDFIKPFNIKNKTHRTYVVNWFLIEVIQHDEMIMGEWCIKDLKKLNQVIASAFIQNILDKKIEDWMNNIIENGMLSLAKDRCEIYNKNKVEVETEKIENIVCKFNPGSSLQKQNLFKYLGIESENETKAGNEKWDRKEMENLQKLIKALIEE